MFFSKIIGQDSVKQKLLLEIKEKRIAHAQLFCGPEGCGKLALAIAYAQYILCEHPAETDVCGECASCKQIAKLAHPDLHFVFPVVKKSSSSSATTSDDFLKEWREAVLRNPYLNLEEWMKAMGEEKTPVIYTAESESITRKLSLKSYEGGYKVMIIWLPEKMQTECSNKLLKLLEEPPSQTVFLLVSEHPEQMLSTITSRTQRIDIPALSPNDIQEALISKFGMDEDVARGIAMTSNGSYQRALQEMSTDDNRKLYFDMFILIMRMSYARRIKEMKQWSETLASFGREKQKNFLEYAQYMLRESFMNNFHAKQLNTMNSEESNFAVRFSPFINEKNIFGLLQELSEAQIHIGQNVNSKIVFFDFALKMTVLLKQ